MFMYLEMYEKCKKKLLSLLLSTDCPQGWNNDLSDFCVQLVNTKLNWHDASRFCLEQNSHLASPKTPEQNSVIGNLTLESGQAAWIGLTDEEEEGVWKWQDGEELQWSSWGDGHPDNKLGNEDCVVVFPCPLRQWEDLNCNTRENQFVCQIPRERKITTNELNYRLPNNVVPLHYDLLLSMEFDFKGFVRIFVRCLVASDMITLHVKNINVDNSSIKVMDSEKYSRVLEVVALQYDKRKNFIIYTCG